MRSTTHHFLALKKVEISRPLREVFRFIFSPLAPRSAPISGLLILYHPKPLSFKTRSSPCLSPLVVSVDILCQPKSNRLKKPAFVREVFHPLSGIFLIPFLSFLPTFNHNFTLLFRHFSDILKLRSCPSPDPLSDKFHNAWDVTDNRKLFERTGRKTTGLSNGGRATEVTPSTQDPLLSDERRGYFFILLRSSSVHHQYSGGQNMKVPKSLIVKHTSNESSHIPLPYRREILARDSHSCHFCHHSTDYLCHDLPKCRGGKTIPSNLLTACLDCRREKGELTSAEYFAVIKLKEENVLKEVTMRIKVFFPDPRRKPIEGEVDSLPDPTVPGFYLRHVGNGCRELIFVEPGMRIVELGGEVKKRDDDET